jgi:hypothetical protein
MRLDVFDAGRVAQAAGQIDHAPPQVTGGALRRSVANVMFTPTRAFGPHKRTCGVFWGTGSVRKCNATIPPLRQLKAMGCSAQWREQIRHAVGPLEGAFGSTAYVPKCPPCALLNLKGRERIYPWF